jgi:branched-chain amino acid transport system substrate-binding protein
MAATRGEASCTVVSGRDIESAPHPTVPMATRIETRVIISPPGSDAHTVAGGGFSPTRIGFLSDMPRGGGVGQSLDPIILAFEDAMNEGRLNRPVELIATHVVGLPTGLALNVIAAYRDLVAQGCVLVHSVGVTDNALVLRDAVNAAKVPLITMAGTTRFVGPHCFSLANGGHGEETAIMAAYLADQGLRRVVVTGERSPGDSEYHAFFQEQARLYGLEILKEHYFDQRPSDDEIDEALRHFRDDLRPDALVYCGFGWNSGQFNPGLERIGWDPPKVMNSAIMWAFSSPEWTSALDGWIGIEQTMGDHDDEPMNPNFDPCRQRFEKRFGYQYSGTMLALFYDQGRAAAEAMINSPLLTGEGMTAGLERIKMMPAVLGGPRTYIEFGAEDHRGYKGDFMFLKQLRDGKFHFTSYHWPQWPISRPGS